MFEKTLAADRRPSFIGSEEIRSAGVRGGDNRTGELFSSVDLEARVRRDHPLRAMRTIVSEALLALDASLSASIRRLGSRRSRR